MGTKPEEPTCDSLFIRLPTTEPVIWNGEKITELEWLETVILLIRNKYGVRKIEIIYDDTEGVGD